MDSPPLGANQNRNSDIYYYSTAAYASSDDEDFDIRTDDHDNNDYGDVSFLPGNTFEELDITDGYFRYENGRRFLNVKGVKYFLPNDTKEADRIHQQHWFLGHAFQGNFEAPVHDALTEGILVLDAGCGPAAWTLEMGGTYPNSVFYGIDIAAVFPMEMVLPNCYFQFGNLEEHLDFPDNHFDYIHQRLLTAGLSVSGWDNSLSELTRILKPGGWLELKEVELDVYSPGEHTAKLVTAFRSVIIELGLTPSKGVVLHESVEALGLLNIKRRKLELPLNNSGKLGEVHWDDFTTFFMTLRPLVIAKYPTEFGVTVSEFEQYLKVCGHECHKNRSYVAWHSVCGQKPYTTNGVSEKTSEQKSSAGDE